MLCELFLIKVAYYRTNQPLSHELFLLKSTLQEIRRTFQNSQACHSLIIRVKNAYLSPTYFSSLIDQRDQALPQSTRLVNGTHVTPGQDSPHHGHSDRRWFSVGASLAPFPASGGWFLCPWLLRALLPQEPHLKHPMLGLSLQAVLPPRSG